MVQGATKRAPKSDDKKALADILAKPAPPPFLLVLTPDRIRRERIRKHFSKQYLPQGEKVKRIVGENLNVKALNNLREDLRSLSLFARHRFFLIDGIEECDAKMMEEIRTLLEELPPEVSLLLSGTKLPSNSRLLKFCQGKGLGFSFDTPKSFELKRWVQKELKDAGIGSYPESLVDLLIGIGEVAEGERKTPLLDTVATLVERAGLFAESGSLTEEEVRLLFHEVPDPNEFELIETIASGNRGKAELLTIELLRAGKSPFLLLALFYRTFATYLSIRQRLDDGAAPAAIRQELGMTEWIFGKYLTGVRPYSISRLKQVLGILVGLDTRLKGRALEPDALFGAIVQRLAP